MPYGPKNTVILGKSFQRKVLSFKIAPPGRPLFLVTPLHAPYNQIFNLVGNVNKAKN